MVLIWFTLIRGYVIVDNPYMSPLLGDLGGEKEGITDSGDIVGLVGEIGDVGDVVGGNTIG